MKRILLACLVISSTYVAGYAQEKPKDVHKPEAVVLKDESYAELDGIVEQLTKAAAEEESAKKAYEAAHATVIALQQAIESARLRALMKLGITDPDTPIAPKPKAAVEKKP